MDNERKIVCDSLEVEEKSRNAILDIMQRLGESTDIINVESANDVQAFLNNLKISLDLYNKNIELLKEILKNIDSISESMSHEKEEPEKNCTPSYSNMHDTIEINVNPIEQISQPEVTTYTNNETIEDDTELSEDTLIISETKGKVVLPYKFSELDRILEKNPRKYSSIEDIIEAEYTLPITNYKNSLISRFREGFKLMYHKEKGSIISSFDLGMELMFNSKLHPAIITACKNLDELDAYLDCLEVKKTYKFDLFRIVFEAPPEIMRNTNFCF